MWAVSEQWGEALAGSHTMTAHAAITLGGEPLAEDLTPDSWQVETTLRGGQIESRLSMVVTDPDGGMLTEASDSPLQAYGQQVSLSVTLESGRWAEAVPMGRWRINESTPSGGQWHLYPSGAWRRGSQQVTTDAEDLLVLLAEYGFLGQSTPPAYSTIGSEVLRLVEGAMPVSLEALHSIPSAAWESGRLDAIVELLTSIDMVAVVDRTGTLRPVAATGTGDAVRIQAADEYGYVDGIATGLVGWTPKASRQGIYNGVAMTGTHPDGSTLYGRWLEPAGTPTAWDAARFGRVLYTAHSPLLTDGPSVGAAAVTRLATLQRTRAQVLDVQIMPNPAIDVLDLAEILLPGADRTISGLITSSVIGSRGPQRLQVSVPFGERIYG